MHHLIKSSVSHCGAMIFLRKVNAARHGRVLIALVFVVLHRTQWIFGYSKSGLSNSFPRVRRIASFCVHS